MWSFFVFKSLSLESGSWASKIKINCRSWFLELWATRGPSEALRRLCAKSVCGVFLMASGGLWWHLAASRGLLAASWRPLAASWRPPCGFWRPLAASRDVLAVSGGSWRPLAASGGFLAAFIQLEFMQFNFMQCNLTLCNLTSCKLTLYSWTLCNLALCNHAVQLYAI